MVEIQFSRGITEPVIPDVRLTKSRVGEQGKATFYFDHPAILGNEVNEDVTGMYMLDEVARLRLVKSKQSLSMANPQHWKQSIS